MTLDPIAWSTRERVHQQMRDNYNQIQWSMKEKAFPDAWPPYMTFESLTPNASSPETDNH